jgi:hypothetical protein
MSAENTARRTTSRTAKTTADSKPRASRTAKTATAQPSSTVDTAQAESPQTSSETTGGDAMTDTATNDNVVQITARPAQEEKKKTEKKKASAIQVQKTSLTIWDRPVMPSEIEFSETMSVAGIRPIETSHLALVGSFLNGRPIAASSLTVHDMLPGDRPVFDSEFKMVDDMMLPGNRPVMVSDPQLMEASILPGNRPIAPNTVDPEPGALMGYLD